jgi:hypothetical protein
MELNEYKNPTEMADKICATSNDCLGTSNGFETCTEGSKLEPDAASLARIRDLLLFLGVTFLSSDGSVSIRKALSQRQCMNANMREHQVLPPWIRFTNGMYRL